MTDDPAELRRRRSIAPEVSRLEVPRSARYYRAGGESAPREIWIVLHGFGMLARKFIHAFTPAVSPERLIVAPEALNHYYTDHETRKVGATWMTSEDREVEIADYVRYLDVVLDDVTVGRSPPERIEIHGFSQGAATATRWAVLGRVPPARLVLWGGGVPPDLDLEAHRDILNRIDLTIVIGDRDRFIPEEKVVELSARLEAASIRNTLRRFNGGHVIPWPVLESLIAYR